jgi:hypothetical protein
MRQKVGEMRFRPGARQVGKVGEMRFDQPPPAPDLANCRYDNVVK